MNLSSITKIQTIEKFTSQDIFEQNKNGVKNQNIDEVINDKLNEIFQTRK